MTQWWWKMIDMREYVWSSHNYTHNAVLYVHRNKTNYAIITKIAEVVE